MTTGYHIRLGYQSRGGLDWPELERLAIDIANDTERITEEFRRIEGRDPEPGFVEALRERRDSSLSIWMPGGDGEPQIMLLASGGNPARAEKERVRRAYCRLLLEAVHRRDGEISISVA